MTRLKGEVSSLSRARLNALEGMMGRIFNTSTLDEAVGMGFHLLDSFVEFLTLTDRVYATRGPILVFHRTRGVLVGSPVGSLEYRGHRLMTYKEWTFGGPSVEKLED